MEKGIFTMSNYKIPINKARQIAKFSELNLEKIIRGSIKSFSNDHPENHINSEIGSQIAKRLGGTLREHFTRLFCDRIILNWIGNNRDESINLLSNMNGSIRDIFSSHITQYYLDND